MKILLFLCLSFWVNTVNAQAANNICADSFTVASTGSLTDSGGARGYYNNKEYCQFLIQSLNRDNITLSFSAFNYENGYDFVRVYDGNSTSGTLLGTFTSNSIPSNLVAVSGTMLVVSTSDSTITYSGFQASWTMSSPTGGSCPEQSVGDNFPSISYGGNSGSENWRGDWAEIGESDGTSAGIARVRNDLCTSTSGYCLRLGVPSGTTPQTYRNKGVYREVDLTDALSATLSFVYRRGVNQGSQTVILSISNDGGNSWTQLQSFYFNRTNTSPASASFDITAFAASNTQIRFLASGRNAVIGMYIDDINISYQASCTHSPILNYRFDECSYTGEAGEVIDQNDNFNADSNGESLNSGQGLINNSLNLTANDSSDWIDVPSSAVHGLDDFSVAVWFKTSINKAQQQIFHALGANTDDDELEIFLKNSNTVYIKVRDNGEDLTSNIGLTDDNWHHLVVTRVDEYVCLYIDSINQQCSYGVNDGVLSVNHANAIVIGQEQDSFGGNFESRQDFEGNLDEFKIYASALSASEINLLYQNELAGDNFDGSTRDASACMEVDHYEIQHNGSGFTCEPKTLTITACANDDCSIVFTEEVSLTLAPSGWVGGDTFTFENDEGQITTALSVTDEGTVTLAIINAEPDADLRCFNGSQESCEIEFLNDGFEIHGAQTTDLVPDQLAAKNFFNVNLRAVRNNNGVCEVLLEGEKEMTIGYDCAAPDACLTSLSSIPIDSDNSGYSYGTVEVDFDENGIASLAMLNYPDAGSIRLTASAVIDGVTFNTADNGQPIDVYPSYLQLSVNETELLYASIGVQNNYKAGAPFTLSIGAYGVNNALLPNYQAENPQIKITRIQPVASLAKEGTVAYSNTGKISSGTSANFVTALSLRSDQNTNPIFSDGEYSYADAYYDEVGRIEIDIKDYNYLGNEITSDSSLVLGDFYPAYFDVTVSDIPTLANTSGVFSYIGEPIGFATAPQFFITAYNALDEITENYSDTYWSYQPDEPSLEAHLSYMDSSIYTSTGTASEIDLGDTPIVTNNVNYDGAGIVTINNGEFQYNKIDTDNSIFDLVSPFDGSIDLVFASDFFTATFIGQTSNGQVSSNTICFKDNYASANCNSLSIKNVIGTELRYGRLTLPSTYGPETEPLVVPIRAEYYDTGQWLLNTDDNHTSIDFDKSANHLALLPSGSTDITGNIGNIFSTGKLLLGVANSSTDFLLNAPNTIGEVKLQLDPSNDPTGWSDYLNYDWNGDGFINVGDRPEATITFGLFRGNDRIIHWREVFD